jgi:hypothetical protein
VADAAAAAASRQEATMRRMKVRTRKMMPVHMPTMMPTSGSHHRSAAPDS